MRIKDQKKSRKIVLISIKIKKMRINNKKMSDKLKFSAKKRAKILASF